VIQFDELCRRAHVLGLAVRGAFHPRAGEFDENFPGLDVQTVVMLGFTGGAQWEFFERSPEAIDRLPHPLDRWSRRLIGSLAQEWDAAQIYPNGPPAPPLSFQKLARRGEPVHQSPIGFLIHPTWGLWHAYRGALLMLDRIELPDASPSVHPCNGCAAKPCLSACPVQAFQPGGLDIAACVAHVRSEAGFECREHGCRARNACPVGSQFRYGANQTRFHMQAFLAGVKL
jgi:hypothetical protein